MKRYLLFGMVCLLILSGCADPGQAALSTPPPSSAAPSAAPSDRPEAPTPAPTAAPQTPPATATPAPTPAPTPEPEGWDGNPDTLSLEDFPTQLVTLADMMQDINEEGSGLYLLAQIPEMDTWLYGLYSPVKDQKLVLRVGERWKVFDLLYLTPQTISPQIFYGDFDGDMELELAILAYTGSGTGISIETLSVVEFGETGWTALTLQAAEYTAVLEQSVFCSHDAVEGVTRLQLGETVLDIQLPQAPGGALTSYVGNSVHFQVEGDMIHGSFAVGLSAPDLPPTGFYPAMIRADVLYTGTSFGLDDLTLESAPT